ncbi:MAG TPA: hypothetical protein VGL78_06045 [Solirubrobacteraceae bacterium]
MREGWEATEFGVMRMFVSRALGFRLTKVVGPRRRLLWGYGGALAFLVGLLSALGVALWIVPTAGAATPQRFTLDFQESDTIDCSEFNPAWTFDDNFTDFFHIEVTVFSDVNGDPLRALSHVRHISNDVNSVSGYTLHEPTTTS